MTIPKSTVEKALKVMAKDRANYVQFFDSLNSSHWIEPLCEHGFFSDPPPVQVETQKGDQVRTWHPPWPESQYLARVAETAPDLVLKVMLQLGGTEQCPRSLGSS